MLYLVFRNILTNVIFIIYCILDVAMYGESEKKSSVQDALARLRSEISRRVENIRLFADRDPVGALPVAGDRHGALRGRHALSASRASGRRIGLAAGRSTGREVRPGFCDGVASARASGDGPGARRPVGPPR